MPEQLANRTSIYQWICEQAPQGGRVLDIGCGEGELLAQLVVKRGVKAVGIELSEECVAKAVGRGLSVHHGNAEEGIDHYPDASFDLVILSLAIQEMHEPLHVIRESFRIGRQLLVVFPNFGYWRARWQLCFTGRAPKTESFPYTWYSSPNRHFFTVADWDDFCREENLRCVRRAFLDNGRHVECCPNLRSEVALYLLEQIAPPRR
jgi:methionine biosynthesis protein MetW